MFLRKSRVEPLPVTMSAVRMGERVLQIGVDNPAIVSAIAAKAGLSGSAALVVGDEHDAARAQSAFATAGVLVDVRVGFLSPLPFESDAFDVVVVHAKHGGITSHVEAMREWHRVLRRGGRVMIIEGGPPQGLTAMFRKQRPPESPESDLVTALNEAGFRSARVLAEREGYLFAEGIKS